MKNKDFTYYCGFYSPLLLAALLVALPQLAKSATNTVSNNLSNKQFHTLSTHPLYLDLNRSGDNRVQAHSGYYRPGMNTAAPVLKAAILNQGERESGHRSIPLSQLQQCHFIAAGIELDNRRDTQEWVVSTRSNCQPTAIKTLWLLQTKTNQAPNVLMSEQANILRISKTRNNGYRTIQTGLNTQLTINNKMHEANCKKSWHYNDQTYVSSREIIKIWGQTILPGGSAYWHKINHVYPDLNEQLPVECPRY